MKENNMKTTSTYTVGRKVVAENGEHIVEKQERQVAVTLNTYPDIEGVTGVFWKGARIA